MNNGILIFGPNGTGKSTLMHAAARMSGYFAMDVEDYYFPEQAEARRADMDGKTALTDYAPFAEPRTKAEVCRMMLADMEKNSRFMLCSVGANWDDDILERIGLAFFVNTPLGVRLERIRERELRRFGGRIYVQQDEFRRMVIKRGEMTAEEAGKRLKCPVVELDGMLPPDENVKRIMEYIEAGTR